MKKLFYLLLISLISFTLVTCNDDDDDLKGWKEENEVAYNAIAEKSAYKEIETESGPSGVFYKALPNDKEKGLENPLQTSSVKVLYKGMYYDGSIFDAGTGDGEVPTEFSTAGTVRGFSYALQNMVVGDKWEIWIPWYLGYGNSGSVDPYTGRTVIKGYTTLVFEVELVEITQYP